MKSPNNLKTAIIKCPYCNSEYLPGEIYMPLSLIGQPEDIVRDSLGKILYADYASETKEPCFTEEFTCELCEKPFVIEATVTYRAKEEAPEKDWSTQYVSLLSD